MIRAAPQRSGGGYCIFLISPGLLNRCRLYARNAAGAPEKCWDREGVRECPNNSTRRHPELYAGLEVHYRSPSRTRDEQEEVVDYLEEAAP